MSHEGRGQATRRVWPLPAPWGSQAPTHRTQKQTNKQKNTKKKKKKTQKRLSGWHSAETPGMQEHLRGQDDQKLVPLFLMFYDLERKGKTFATFLNAENE